MAEIQFKGKLVVTGDLAEDLRVPRDVWKAVALAVKEQMESSLSQHIETDVYRAYKPRIYKRRSKNGELGVPLDDLERNATSYATIESDGRIYIRINYNPTGDHVVKKWSGTDGDALIGRIEKSKPAYKWPPTDESAQERPFWQNFVSEMVDSGGFAEAISNAFMLQGYQVSIDGVTRTHEDGQY